MRAKSIYFVSILFIIWRSALAKEHFKQHPRQKRHTSVISVFRNTRNSKIHSPTPKIVHHAPIKHFQHGPYYINHYILCDGVDHSGINHQKPLNFLDIPKGEANHHLANSFNVDLPSVDFSSFGDGFNAKGSNFFNQKFEEAFLTSHEVLNINSNIPVESHSASILNHNIFNGDQGLHEGFNKGQELFDVALESGSPLENHDLGETNGEEEHHHGLSKVPVYHQPLEKDTGKATYNTPGAVDSYGHPLRPSHPPNHRPDYATGFHEAGVRSGNSINNHHFLSDITNGYLESFKEINGVHRLGRHIVNKGASVSEKSGSSPAAAISETGTNELNIRHPNHKYE